MMNLTNLFSYIPSFFGISYETAISYGEIEFFDALDPNVKIFQGDSKIVEDLEFFEQNHLKRTFIPERENNKEHIYNSTIFMFT